MNDVRFGNAPAPAAVRRRNGPSQRRDRSCSRFCPADTVSHAGAAARRARSNGRRGCSAARRAMTQLAQMSDYELRDIGLTRQDVVDVTALPLDEDPTALLARRRARRRAAQSRGLSLGRAPPDAAQAPLPSGAKRSRRGAMTSSPTRGAPMTRATGRRNQGPRRSRARGSPKSSAPTRSPSSPTCTAASTRGAASCSRARMERQKLFDAGELPDFLPETKAVRDGDWTVAPIPADLLDRRVEITGPVDRKMIVNALNSGAKVFMADFEDATSPVVRQHDRGPGQPQGPAGRARSTSPIPRAARPMRSRRTRRY